MTPVKWNRGVSGGVFRPSLIDLQVADFEPTFLRLHARLQAELVACEINGRNLQFLRRVMRLDVGLQILQIGKARVLGFEVEVAIVLKRLDLALAGPIHH